MVVGGESGVGKSRLVAELADRAAAAGARVLSGDCVDLGDAELPYAPVVAALRALSHALEPGELDRVLGGAGADLAPLMPELAPRDRDPSAGPVAQQRLFELLLGVLGRLGEDAPLVLVTARPHHALLDALRPGDDAHRPDLTAHERRPARPVNRRPWPSAGAAALR